MAALTISGRVYRRHFRGSINAHKLLLGLEQLRRWIGKPLVLIWDRSRAHRAKCVQAYLASHPEIMAEFLSGYAPELNPKSATYAMATSSISETGHRARWLRYKPNSTGFVRMRRRPDLLLACFHHAGLAL